MSRPPLEVADLIRAAGAAFIERSRKWISWKHSKVLLAIARCRTAALGGHLDQCTRCGHRATISYNSCRNRHCPKCQTGARERWIAARRSELLPSRYVHVVFTACCTPGTKSSSFTRMSIAWFLPADSPPITPIGFPHAIGFFFPSMCSVAFFAASSLLVSGRSSKKADSTSMET